MTDYKGLSDAQLMLLIRDAAGSHYAQSIKEYIERKIVFINSSFDSVGDTQRLGQLQGGKSQLKDLQSLLTPLPAQGTVPAE